MRERNRDKAQPRASDISLHGRGCVGVAPLFHLVSCRLHLDLDTLTHRHSRHQAAGQPRPGSSGHGGRRIDSVGEVSHGDPDSSSGETLDKVEARA